MKMNFRMIGKLGFLLVIIGFLMPIACDMNGFELADALADMDSSHNAVLLYGIFISALVGLLVGALLMMKKNVPVIIDWLALLVCIVCGVAVYLGALNDNSIELQSGAYVIVIGWVVALISQIKPFIKKK